MDSSPENRSAADELSAAEVAAARAWILHHFVSTGGAPTLAEASRALRWDLDRARQAFAELARTGTLTLDRESGEIWRAAPFCAVPTEFDVHVGPVRYWGTCAWDAFGIPAALGKQAEIGTACACCSQSITLAAGPEGLAKGEGVVHFAVPTRHWYDDLVFT